MVKSNWRDKVHREGEAAEIADQLEQMLNSGMEMNRSDNKVMGQLIRRLAELDSQNPPTRVEGKAAAIDYLINRAPAGERDYESIALMLKTADRATAGQVFHDESVKDYPDQQILDIAGARYAEHLNADRCR